MVTFTEPRHPAEFLLSEANGYLSREVVTLASNGSTAIAYPAGAVLAQLTSGGKFVWYDNAGSDGTEVARAILLEAATVPATGDLKAVVIARHAEVQSAELAWDPGLSGGTLTTAIGAAVTDFATHQIIVR
jgi:hypothetical protein